jgi:DNA-binding CsgD family transcriptional regulator
MNSQSPSEVFEDVFFKLVDEVEAVSSITDGHSLLKAFVARYGLKNAAYLGINIPGLTHNNRPYIAVTYSNEWVHHYCSQNYFDVDPVLPATMRTLLPLDWSEVQAGSRKVIQFFGEAEEFGVGRHGLSFPIRGRHGETALFAITQDCSHSEWASFRRHCMRDFQILAFCFHELILRAESRFIQPSPLSRRERECLYWASRGKTFGEIGIILSLSERTVKFYLDIARHKLGATNITEAVAKAVTVNALYEGQNR